MPYFACNRQNENYNKPERNAASRSWKLITEMPFSVLNLFKFGLRLLTRYPLAKYLARQNQPSPHSSR